MDKKAYEIFRWCGVPHLAVSKPLKPRQPRCNDIYVGSIQFLCNNGIIDFYSNEKYDTFSFASNELDPDSMLGHSLTYWWNLVKEKYDPKHKCREKISELKAELAKLEEQLNADS